MAWMIPLATTAAGVWTGAEEYQAQRAAEERDRELNAIEAAYSYALSPQYRQVQPAGSQTGQILAGGMTGLQLGMGVSKGMGKWGTPSDTTPKPQEKFTSANIPAYASPQGARHIMQEQDQGVWGPRMGSRQMGMWGRYTP